MVLKYQMPFSNPDVPDGFGSTLPPRTQPHRGLDFAQPVGTPIPAVAAGVIADKGYSGDLGYYTVIGHPDGMYTGYCHSFQQSPLALGATVNRGATINTVGNLGFTTGPHLHLTLSTVKEGVHTGPVQDPFTFINARLNGDDPTTPTPEDEDMARPMYYVAADNSGLGASVGVNDIWVRSQPGEPLRRMSAGQWTDYYNRDRPDLTGDLVYKAGSWFAAAFSEDNIVHGVNKTVHPWMVGEAA